jgi:ATP synthase protein I
LKNEGSALKKNFYKYAAYKIVVAQFLITIVIAAIVLIAAGVTPAYSALSGGMISVVASLYLAGRLFSQEGIAPAAKVLRAFYFGEALKILLTIGLFVFVILVFQVDVLYAVMAYMATLPVYWFALLTSGPRPKTGKKN